MLPAKNHRETESEPVDPAVITKEGEQKGIDVDETNREKFEKDHPKDPEHPKNKDEE